jgi:hypothetical protein
LPERKWSGTRKKKLYVNPESAYVIVGSLKVAALELGLILLCCIFLSSSAYSQNGSNVEIEPERLQIFLRNDTSGPQTDDRTKDIIIPIITASSAIGGAILGTYFTGRYTMNLEKKRIDEQQRKEREFHQRIRRLVYVELIMIGVIFKKLQECEALDDRSKSAFKTMMNIERQYPKLLLETKVLSFAPNVLEDMEYAYQFFSTTRELFKVAFPKFESGEITLEQLKKRLNLKNAYELIESAEKTLASEHEHLKGIDTKALTEHVSAQ